MRGAGEDHMDGSDWWVENAATRATSTERDAIHDGISTGMIRFILETA